MALPEEIDMLMEDWFDRDVKTYVKQPDISRRLYRRLLNGTSLHDFAKKRTPTEIIAASAGISKNMLSVMRLKITPKVHVNKSADDSYTDGSTIVVSSKMFDDNRLTREEALYTYVGVTIHEGLHIKHTDFDIYRTACSNATVKFIANVLEDERIESTLADDTPGLVRFIEQLKLYYFGIKKPADEKQFFDEGKTWDDGTRLMEAFLKIIRFPKYLSNHDVEEFADRLLEIRNILYPYPTNTQEVVNAAFKIYDVVKDLMKEQSKVSVVGRSRASEDYNNLSEEEKQKIDDFLKELLEKLDEHLQSLGEAMRITNLSEDDTADVETMDDVASAVDDIIDGKVELNGTDYYIKEVVDKAKYNEVLAKVRKYIPAVRTAISYNDVDTRIVHTGMRNGLLDTNKIAEAVQGSDTVYRRYDHIVSDKYAVCLVIDLSGSMGGGDKIKAAQEVAVLLAETLCNNNSIELYIYGHTADNSYGSDADGRTDIHIFYEPGFNNKYTLGSIDSHANNRDGVALEMIRKRVRKFTKKKCLMFVVADGQPNAENYEGMMAVYHTKRSVQEIEKDNFDVINIAIESRYEPSSMFSNFIKLTDMRKLAPDLGKLIQKKILKNQKAKAV